MAKSRFAEKLKELKRLAGDEHAHVFEDLSRIEQKLDEADLGRNAWDKVKLARHPERPTTLEYIDRVFDRFFELHGDRTGGDDPAIIGGLALFEGRPVTVVGHQKGRSLKENLRRNYGMAGPEGYRKALRLAREAERFRRPVVTFIDTPGAYPGISAEERGIGEAIARNLKEFSRLSVPVIGFIIGEGGSGGALGIGVTDEIYMLHNAVYSVISPEGCASILLRDAGKASLAADLMRLTAEHHLEAGIIDGIIDEGSEGAHGNPDLAAEGIKRQLADALARLGKKKTGRLRSERSKRLLSLGPYLESPRERSGFFSRIFG
jgi:acetyl-CoA carboxylase carboxyl transferase subunit alpha